MKIHKIQEEDKLTFVLEGRLDTVTAPELEKEVRGSLDGITELTFDLEKLDYISSAGLRTLMSAYKIMISQGGSLRIVHTQTIVKEIFEVTGFLDIMNIQ